MDPTPPKGPAPDIAAKAPAPQKRTAPDTTATNPAPPKRSTSDTSPAPPKRSTSDTTAKDSAPSKRPALDIAAVEFGHRLRCFREERGISLSALARAAGVGKATLSGLETGTRNATMDTLWKVTTALGVPVTTLLGPVPNTVFRGEAVESTLLQVFDDAEVTYELYRLHIPAGAAQISPAHRAGVSEHLTIFHGALRAGPAHAPLTATAGDFLSWTSDSPHGYEALGVEDVHASLLMRYPKPER